MKISPSQRRVIVNVVLISALTAIYGFNQLPLMLLVVALILGVEIVVIRLISGRWGGEDN